jgi:hypothetical protein
LKDVCFSHFRFVLQLYRGSYVSAGPLIQALADELYDSEVSGRTPTATRAFLEGLHLGGGREKRGGDALANLGFHRSFTPAGLLTDRTEPTGTKADGLPVEICDEKGCVEAAAWPQSHRPDTGPAPLAGTGAVVLHPLRILTSHDKCRRADDGSPWPARQEER